MLKKFSTMENIENKTDNPSISIAQAFLIIGILFAVSLPVSLLQVAVLQQLPGAKSWILLFSYMLQFGLALLISVKIFNIKYFDTKKFKISVLLLSLVLIFALSLISESLASLIPMPDFIAEPSFIWFKNIKIRQNRIINSIAASTFGIFLIHANSTAMRQWLWVDTLNCAGKYDLSFLRGVLYSFGGVVTVFMICFLLDRFRLLLFGLFTNKHMTR